jgi:hypothetical protein
VRRGVPSTAGASVAVVVVLALALHYVSLQRFRHGYLTEWDESGYMQFALSNFDALHDHGLVAFAKTVGGRGTFGPLLPAVTAFAYPIVGRGIFGSLLVLPLFFGALVFATYGVARQLVSDAWAVVAALAVAAIPDVTDYTRLYHFSVPATACMTAALWALLRSDGFRRTGWAVSTGVFVALTVLARTMTVAFLPGLVAAAAVAVLVGRSDRRLRIRNLALAGLATLVVAGPWYIRNARSVGDYLFGGYGDSAARYGRHYPIASWGYWTKELRIVLDSMWLPLGGALALCFAAALVLAALRYRRYGQLQLSPLTARAGRILVLVVVVAEGYLALTSSRNEGTAFALPWLPALVILAVAAAASASARPLRIALAGVLVAVSLVALASKSGSVAPLAAVRNVAVPGFGSVPVTDGRDLIQQMVADAGYDIGPITQPLPSIHRRWLPLEREVVGWSIRQAKARGTSPQITLGLDDLLFTNTRLILPAQVWFHRFLPVDYLQSSSGGDKVSSYRNQLASHPVNALITGEGPPYASITRRKVEAAARSLGFVRSKAFTLPDGRTIWMWWRGRSAA